MNGAACERAAALLVAARRSHRPQVLPPECRPVTLDDAYAIQNRVTAALGLRLVGFKIGATSASVAAAEGASEPVSGRLFAPHVRASPARLPAEHFTSFRNCEVEFAVRLGRPLATTPGMHERAVVVAAVEALIPAIEIGDSRLADRASAGIIAITADNAGGTELVLGEPVCDWRSLDLPGHAVTLHINGEVVATGHGADVMGDPIEALTWLVNQRAAVGEPLPAGTLVATGSCTGINIAMPGDAVMADFGSLGRVEIEFGA